MSAGVAFVMAALVLGALVSGWWDAVRAVPAGDRTPPGRDGRETALRACAWPARAAPGEPPGVGEAWLPAMRNVAGASRIAQGPAQANGGLPDVT
ncbi:hypothetical protein SHKM778_23260 [Streptomyces sp. KM77-8]|uniref:Uncharacterized protein n=1 Tax=Streptomyces haneummycinicus TaxID=3074435 RepID=A0AAT9HF68_9ACTN